MEDSTPSEVMIREYLLGRLEAGSELVERIDQQLLEDAEFAETVDIVEDELIEEYIEGTLSPADKLAMQKHFLQPPERQHKLRIARSLSRHFATTTSRNDGPATVRSLDWAALQWWPRIGMYGGIAAVVLLVISSTFLIWQRYQFQNELQEANQKLVNEREHSKLLSGQLEVARALAQPATVLSLLEPGISRGGAPLPQLTLGSKTQSVHVEIALPSSVPGSYDIRLESAEKVVLLLFGLKAVISPVGSVLRFDVSAQLFATGENKFVVTRGNEVEISYLFEMSRQ